jgi:hypothetical protein
MNVNFTLIKRNMHDLLFNTCVKGRVTILTCDWRYKIEIEEIMM